MMHICFLSNEYPKAGVAHGGIGSFLKTVAPVFVKSGLHVSIVGINISADYEQYNDDEVTVYRLPKSNVKGLAWWFNSRALNKKLLEIHRVQPINIIEGAELSFAFITKLPAIKYVIRLHGGHHFFSEAENRGINWWKGFQEKRSFAKADAFIAVSEFVKIHTAKYLSYHNKPVTLIRNPVDTALFAPRQSALTNKIVFAGTVCEKKGIRQLVQAFPTVHGEFPTATLEIYGRDWTFPDGKSYIQYLIDSEISKMDSTVASNIHFRGAVSHAEMPSVYADAGVCVFPSHMETMGLVAPEAMSMQKAVVFTIVGPGPEIIIDGETGLLCNPHDAENIAAQICRVLDDPTLAAAMGRNARAFVVNAYGLTQIIDINITFYRSLL